MRYQHLAGIADVSTSSQCEYSKFIKRASLKVGYYDYEQYRHGANWVDPETN